jgi:hypothetical protein
MERAPQAGLAALTDTARWIRFVGGWQIIGGAAAAVTWLDGFARLPEKGLIVDAIFLFMIGVAIMSIVAGIGLVKERKAAILPSLLVQGLQVVGFSLGDFVYQIRLGPYIDLLMVWTQGLSITGGFRAAFTLSWPVSPPAATGAAVNLLACFCFWTVLWYEPPPQERPSATGVATLRSPNE